MKHQVLKTPEYFFMAVNLGFGALSLPVPRFPALTNTDYGIFWVDPGEHMSHSGGKSITRWGNQSGMST